MNRSQQHRHLWVALAACLAIAGLSQCRFVDDTISGVDLKNNSALSARSDCVRLCNEIFKDGMEQENERHKAAVRACGNDKACRDAANDVHKAVKEQLQEAKKTCKGGCYNEGSGTAGK